MKKGQASIETLILLVIVITLATFIVSKYLNQQNEIFINASARQAFISEVDNLNKNYYLIEVKSSQCTDNVKVSLDVVPDIINSSDIEETVEDAVTATINKIAVVEINPESEFLNCP